MGTTASLPASHQHGPSTATTTAKMRRLKHPKDPYHKHGHRRSCLNPVFLLQQGIPKGSSPSLNNTNNSNMMTVLMQLTLLRDWQRVLIRARLFGNEVSKVCTVKLFEGKNKFRVLPLHVACALDPPPQVIEALLVQAPTIDMKKKKSKKTPPQRVLITDDGQHVELASAPAPIPPPLSLAVVPVVFAHSKRKVTKKQNHHHHTTTTKPPRHHSWKKTITKTLLRGPAPREDQQELLLQQKGSSSSVVLDIYCDDDDNDSMLESRLASNGSSVSGGAVTDLYAYSMEAATILQEQSSPYLSPENSIGDDIEDDDDNGHSICSTAEDSDSFHTSSEDVYEDDVEVVAAEDSSILGSFLEQQGVVLQLTNSGNIQPLPVQQLKSSDSPEEWSTIEPKPSGASSSITHSLSQQSSIFSDGISPTRPSVALDTEAFIQTLVEEGSQSQLLPIHIACLYQASAATLKVLLDAYPEGSLTVVHGMLPIHLIAANWKLPPIPLSSNPAISATPSGLPSSLLYSELGLEDENAVEGKVKRDRLQVLIEATPESLLAKSVCHDLRPLEYIQFLLDSKSSELPIKHEEVSLFFLEDAEKGYQRKTHKTSILESPSGATSHKGLEVDRTNSSSSNTSTTVASSTVEGASSMASSTASFGELLQQGRWYEAMSRLEIDHDLAKEWHYGIDKYNPITNEPCTLWKRLPLHIVCAGVPPTQESVSQALPIGLVQLLINVNPEALRAVDPHTGMIPLHLACRSSAAANPTGDGDAESFASILLQVIRIALKVFPHLTKVVDSYGRLPLHHAVMAGAPYAVLELLVRQDPGTVLSPDQDGVTPLSRAQKTYSSNKAVMSLMELSWL